MNPPAPDAEVARRIGDLAELAAKVGGAFGIVWALVMKVYIPYREWRLRSLTVQIRAALAPEIAAIGRIAEADATCADRLSVVAAHQADFAEELDVFLELAKDNRDRHNETTELLSAVGLSADRRLDIERRNKRFDDLIETLVARRRARLREAENRKGGA